MWFTVLLTLLLQAPAEEPKKPWIEGTVVEESSGQPVQKATVTLARAGLGAINPPKAETGADGTFRFDDIEAGRYVVYAEKTGYARRAAGAKNDGLLRGTQIRVAGKDGAKVEIRLVKQGLITGKVTDAEGEPMQGAIVLPLRPVYQRGKKTWMPIVQAIPPTTNDAGEYRLSSLPAGKYLVCVMPLGVISGARMTTATPKAGPSGKPETSVVSCYPNVTERSQAVAVEVADAAEVPGINVQLARRVVTSVKGQITGLPASPPPMIALALSPRGSGVIGMTLANRAILTGGTGKFEFQNVTAGSYILHTLPLPTGMGGVTVKMPVEIGDEPVADLSVPVIAPLEVHGRFVLDGSDEAPKLLNGGRVILAPSDEVYQTVPQASINADGTFSLAGVAVDKYTLTVTGLPDGSYLKAVRYGDQSRDDSTVEITSPPAPFTLVVSAAGATVTGPVQDDKGDPAPGVFVALLHKGKNTSRNRVTRVDDKGVFRIQGMAPGEYAVFAAEDLEDGALEDDDYVKPFLAKAMTVKVESGGQQALTLKLQRR